MRAATHCAVTSRLSDDRLSTLRDATNSSEFTQYALLDSFLFEPSTAFMFPSLVFFYPLSPLSWPSASMSAAAAAEGDGGGGAENKLSYFVPLAAAKYGRRATRIPQVPTQGGAGRMIVVFPRLGQWPRLCRREDLTTIQLAASLFPLWLPLATA